MSFLGSGAFGCVFSPAIKCNDQSNKPDGKVGKLFRDNRMFSEELATAKKVQEFDKDGRHINKLVQSCSVNSADIKDADRCFFLKEPDYRYPKYNQLIYKHKGLSLDKFAQTKKFKLQDIMRFVLQILKGVKALQANKHAHMDLKLDNILIAKEKSQHKALIIDLGLVRPYSQVYDWEYSDFLMDIKRWYYPPEVQLDFTDYEDWDIEDLQQNLDETYQIVDDDDLKKMRIKQLPTLLKDFKQKIQGKSELQINKIIENHIAKKLDIFSLGMIMYVLLKKLRSRKIKYNQSVFNQYKQIAFKAIHMNPFKRYDIDEFVNAMEGMTNTSDQSVEETLSLLDEDEDERLEELFMDADSVSMSTTSSRSNSASSSASESSKSSKYSKSTGSTNRSTSTINTNRTKSLQATNKTSSKDRSKPLSKSKTASASPLREATKQQPSLNFTLCLSQYTIPQLKAVVDEKNLPKIIKRMRKKEMCERLSDHLKYNQSETSKKKQKPTKKPCEKYSKAQLCATIQAHGIKLKE